MTIQKVSLEARELAADKAREVGIVTTREAHTIRSGGMDDHWIVQSFAQFEQLIRSKVINEAAGVLKRARDEIERLEYPYIGESAASVIADIDASIRQLGERGRG
jgi:hypothetical protein